MAQPPIPVADIVYNDMTSGYVNAAAIALLVYDTLITLDVEVKYVWSSPWTFGRVSFHFNRIWSIVIICITSPITFGHWNSLLLCRAMVGVYGIGAIFLVFNITCIMILRAWVLYDQRKTVLILLALALTGSLILCIVDLTIQLKNMKLFPSILPDILTGCQVDVPLDIARIPYISAFVVDTSIFMLTIWRTWTLNKSGDGSPLINRLARDGTVFYLINSASLAFAIVGLGLGVSGYLIAFHSALCTRMVLSLRTYEPGGLPTTDIKVGAIPAGFTLRSGTNTSIAHAHDSSTLIELGDATNFSQEAPP